MRWYSNLQHLLAPVYPNDTCIYISNTQWKYDCENQQLCNHRKYEECDTQKVVDDHKHHCLANSMIFSSKRK